MKNFRFIFLRLSIYLIAGILLAFYIEVSLLPILILGASILSFFLFTYFRARTLLFPDHLFGFTAFLTIFYLGFLTAYFIQPSNQPGHYISQNIEPTDSLLVSGIISEELKPTAYSQRFILETESLIKNGEKKKIKGKVLINLTADSLKTLSLKPGIRILLPWTPEEIKVPLNPFQFSYKDYLSQLRIEKQLNLKPSEVIINGSETSLRSRAWNFRERLIANLKEYNFEADELAVFQALILGQRREINNELYKNYAAAGAIHILAISGLHIGILLLLLNFLLKPLENIKHGRFLKPVFIILLLWAFAFLTGLSASVVRAVCMFSFLAIGLQLKRKTSSLNSLFLSLFFLLLINPYYLFQVGFQLSYLAVFSIIIFQPFLYGLITTKIKILDYFWKLTTVSLAAQIGVIPLSIYYFHQFPGLFLVSNLVLLPFLGIILLLGITVIILAEFSILPGILEKLYSYLLNLMNRFIEKVAEVDSMVLSNINFSLLQTLALYLIILSFIFFISKINFQRISLFLIGIILFQVSGIYHKWNIPAHETVIFHQSRNTVLGHKNDKNFQVFSNSEKAPVLLNDYLRERNIKQTEYRSIPNITILNEKLTIIIDTIGSYELENFSPQLIILRNSPKINLDRIIALYSPEIIIADGSNYKSYVTRWKRTSENKKIPFHYTGEKGAYILKD